MKTNSNDLAYPSHQALEELAPNHHDKRNQVSGGGLTKREYFAAMALQGLIANCMTDFSEDAEFCKPSVRAEQSVILSDALIEALNKESGK